MSNNLAKYLKVKKKTLTVLIDHVSYDTVNSSNIYSNSNIIVIVVVVLFFIFK